MVRQQVGRVTKPRTRLGASGRVSAERVNLVLNDSVPMPSQSQVPVHLYQPPAMAQFVSPVHLQYQLVQSSMQQPIQDVRQPFREIGNIQSSMQQPIQSVLQSNHIEHELESENEAELFTKPMNLKRFWKKSFIGNLLVNQMETAPTGEEAIHELSCKIVNFVMQMLVEKLDGKLNLKRDKVEILHNVAQRIVITFPVLKTSICQGENWKWTHVTTYFSFFHSV